MPETPWYRDLFGEEYLLRYEHHLPPERTEREVEGLLALLGLPEGARILDLCCGHGRHSLALAERGFQVTGQDLSTVFLDRARASAANQGLTVRWIESDMRQIPFEAEFDAVINIFTAFGYLEDEEEDRKVLHAVRRALKPGGRFLIETIHRDSLFRRFLERQWAQLSGGVVELQEHRLDLLTSRDETSGSLIYPDGRRSEFRVSLRLYTAAELVAMLRSAGLELEEAYGGLDRTPLTLESRRLVLIARKPA